MYTFSSKLKTLSFILMIVGILGIGYGFLTAPKDIQEVEKILAAEEHHEGKHAEATHEEAPVAPVEAHTAEAAPKAVDSAVASHDTISIVADTAKTAPVAVAEAPKAIITHKAHAEVD
ncbi:MAG TPA: hypothetical protein VK623_05250, partial [Flavobacterium sp.]|nr:hypothetical protein [Flavobacterium sp.]